VLIQIFGVLGAAICAAMFWRHDGAPQTIERWFLLALLSLVVGGFVGVLLGAILQTILPFI
jgi:hypothetical protein